MDNEFEGRNFASKTFTSEKGFLLIFWAMTGGSVIKGETSLQTIERETLEELGVQLDMKKVQYIGTYRTENVWLNEYLVEQEIDLKDIIMQEEEVCEVKWASFEDIDMFVENGEFIANRWEFVRDLIKNINTKSNFWGN